MTFDRTEPYSDKIINPKVGALFVGLLVVFVYLFFALDAVEAESIIVSVSVNGLTSSQATAYRTVGELVNAYYPDTSQLVSLSPSRETELTPYLQIAIQVKPARVNSVVAANLRSAVKKAAEPSPKSPTFTGSATWYRFGNNLTTASTQFTKGTRLRVTAVHSGKQVDVVVNDYGPEPDTGVVLDLNKPAFAKIAPLGAGQVAVRYYVI